MSSISVMTSDRIVAIDPTSPDQSLIDRTCELLANDQLVVAPTETRYGLLARADSPIALENLFILKGRRHRKPSAIFVADLEQIRRYAIMSSIAERIASEFLPGPLTLVLLVRKDLGELLTTEGKTGFRVSSSPVIKAILQKLEFPLTATSANLSDQPECLTALEAYEVLGEQVALYIDVGVLNNPASTVVEVMDGSVRILRAGAIAEKTILAAVNQADGR